MTDKPITLTAQQLDARHSEVDKARAFEWLRALAVADSAPSEAGVMLDAYAALADRAANAPQDAFPALRALTEALLTRADPDYLRGQVDAAVKVMAAHGCEPPTPWPDEDFGVAVWGRASDATARAMAVVLKAMKDDPEYAWSWHCNIAMAFVDEGGNHAQANRAAARFMRLLADVEPAHPLPEDAPTASKEAFHAAAHDALADHLTAGQDPTPENQQRAVESEGRLFDAIEAAPIPAVDAVAGEPVALSDVALSYLNPYVDGYGGQTWAEGFRACEQSFLAVATQPRADSTASASVQGEPDMRAICEALGFDPTNHHNAAKCPYCRPAQGVMGAEVGFDEDRTTPNPTCNFCHGTGIDTAPTADGGVGDVDCVCTFRGES